MLPEYVRELQRAIIDTSARIDDLEARMERLERLTGHYADETTAMSSRGGYDDCYCEEFCDDDDDPGEHFMDDDGRPEPDWVDGEDCK